MPIGMNPSFERNPIVRDLGDPHVLVVGASHAARLAEQLKGLVLVDDVCVSGWRAGKASSEALASKISEKLARCTSYDLIILQLFDNTSFYARTCEGGLIPCRRELNSSTYHIDGDLVLQPFEALERSFEDCKPIFEACREHKTVILSPMPRYIMAGCCQDEEHAPNRRDTNFRSFLISGLERTKKNLKMLADKAVLGNCTVYNPLWLIAGPKKKSEAEILQIIEEGWGNQPVHPENATYAKLAGSVVNQCLANACQLPLARQEGIGLLADIPEWQKIFSSYRGKRPIGQLPGGKSKYIRRY
jgi:hypothetical protein